VWGAFVDIVEAAVDDEDEKEFRQDLEPVQKKLGATFEEVFSWFGNHAAFYMGFPATLGSVGEQGAIVVLKEPDKVRGLLEKIQGLPEIRETVAFKEETYKDVPFVSVTFKNLALPLMPSYCFLEGRLIVTENPFSLKKLIAAVEGGGGSLADSEKFKTVLGYAFPDGASLGVYTDLSVMVERLYGAVVPVLTMTLSTTSLQKQWKKLGIDLNLLPSAQTVARPLGTGWEYIRIDAEGFEYCGRSAFGAGFFGFYKAIVGAIVPFAIGSGMREEIEDHQEEVSREHLKKIYDSINVYRRTVGGGKPPRDLLALVSAGLVEEGVLVAPADPQPRLLEDPETGDELPVSYRYRPRGFEGKEEGIVLYEAEAWYSYEHRLVVLKNGMIRTVYSDGELERMLKSE
jgi:hypothetical protein